MYALDLDLDTESRGTGRRVLWLLETVDFDLDGVVAE